VRSLRSVSPHFTHGFRISFSEGCLLAILVVIGFWRRDCVSLLFNESFAFTTLRQAVTGTPSVPVMVRSVVLTVPVRTVPDDLYDLVLRCVVRHLAPSDAAPVHPLGQRSGRSIVLPAIECEQSSWYLIFPFVTVR
jgi:hypothetical protein